MKYKCIVFGFLFACALVSAQTKLPFRLTENNNIILKTIVNEKDSLDLMFQIAMDEGAIVPNPIHAVNTIKYDTSNYSASNDVQISDKKWTNFPFTANQYSGLESDGKIGMQLFEGQVLEVNYDNSQLVMHQKMPSVQGYRPVKIDYRNGAMFIEVESKIGDETYKHWFYLQSGYSGALLYDDIFSEQQQLSEKLVIVSEKILKNSRGQQVATKYSVVSDVKVQGFEFNNVAVGYFEGELKNQPFSLFGADMLKRFNWIINADRSMAWIKPSKYYNTPYLSIQ
ncbi:MAG: hypothetical protein LBI72_07530 [Flavobacteriaceae bacterium]|nr:hypothetical protein [Flavobacteriaceae bacterium]